MPHYQKPKITQKKIKLSFFLSNIAWLNQFNLTGNVYAQSSNCGDACIGAGGCNCSCAQDTSCQCGCSCLDCENCLNSASSSCSCVGDCGLGDPGPPSA